jgi:hypothetical protein
MVCLPANMPCFHEQRMANRAYSAFVATPTYRPTRFVKQRKQATNFVMEICSAANIPVTKGTIANGIKLVKDTFFVDKQRAIEAEERKWAEENSDARIWDETRKRFISVDEWLGNEDNDDD